ncbi:MAG: TIGR01548 family HAD-type hydrolase [Pseudanabaenaceae cyanobacterium SKYGB_i_bin29]|nr:TIGR01548 family HAD-type hydrolase [Pseudanabaenaceae cyanobacterium SKYG29]MDW8420573.1 TIGR01548 family HAD-type hydrolase [Pseudanabaenaceae cyanobacterium SKYGB_i_bin29]
MISQQSCALVLDIDGVIRDVSQSYRRAIADTVEHFSGRRPTMGEIDRLKQEGLWNNDWRASQELIRRFAPQVEVEYQQIVSFFQARYRGQNWDGYIQQEPLLVDRQFFQGLEAQGIPWGFFSGATRASALFVLRRLGLDNPLLVAMEDAPGKPDPTGLIQIAEKLDRSHVLYVGDTVADMLTVCQARERDQSRTYKAIGVIPPHVTEEVAYGEVLRQRGADRVLRRLVDLTF